MRKITILWRVFTSFLIIGMMLPMLSAPSAAAPGADPVPPPDRVLPSDGPAFSLFEEGSVYVRVVAPEGTDLSKYGQFVARRIPDPVTNLTVYYGVTSEEGLQALKADGRVADVARMQLQAATPNSRPDPDVDTKDLPDPEELRARLTELRDNPPEPTERPEPTGWWDVSAGGHNGIEAWNSGYTGEGVWLAVNDSGVDMAHPDLWGTEARYVNVSGHPYYDYFEGWPVALSPQSNYLMAYDLEFNGRLTPYNTFAYGYSHFADTSATGTGSTILFGGSVYTTTGTASPHNPVYHIGYHPDWSLGAIWGEPVAVLVVDEDGDMLYDTVYVDLNDNHDFRDDKPVRKDTNPADDYIQGADELAWWDADLDGYPDLSGGMLYFIADGYHCPPFFDVYFGCSTSPHGGYYDPPGNGDLVAFMFVNLFNTDHGQLCASNVVGQGNINGGAPDWKPDGTGGMVQGLGRDAKLVPVGDIYIFFEQSVEQAWWFQALGYDGWVLAPQFPGGDDNVQASSNSFGPWYVYEDGWDEWSRIPTYINYFVNPYTTFFMSAGNTGAGYGTTGAPQPITAIQLGASSQYGSTDIFEPIASLDQITAGDLVNWSSRGPSANNKLVPHLAANGSWGTGDLAINEVGNGWYAWDLWGGTSRSGPVALGAGALVMDAYQQRYTQWPDWQTVRQALMQGANHISYDPLTGGTGYLNAGRSAHIAAGDYGVLVAPDYWDVGDFMGKRFPGGFAHIAEPGKTYTTALTITNVDAANNVTVTVSDYVLEPIGVYTYTFTSANYTEEDGAFLKPDYLFNVEDIVGGPLPNDTAFMVAELLYPYDYFDADGDDQMDSYYRLIVYDWTDLNGDGDLWEDTNNNGLVNWDEIDAEEYVRYTYSYWTANYQMVTVGDPLNRHHDGIFLGVRHRVKSASVPTTPLTIRVVLYKRADWAALDTSDFGGTQTIGAGGALTTTLVFTAPNKYGLYQGAVLLEVEPDGAKAYETVVPVMVNVAYSGDLTSEPAAVRFGDVDDPNARYSNGYVWPIFDWSQGRATGGEWRFFFLNQETNPNPPGHQAKMVARVTWDGNAPPADIDSFLLGPDYHFSSISNDPGNEVFGSSYGTPGDFWGPYSLRIVGKSESPMLSGGRWAFETATGGNVDYAVADFNHGLNGFQIHSHRYDGLSFREAYTVEVGYIDAPEFLEWENYATVPVTLTTNLTFTEGVSVTAFGASPTTIADLDDVFVPGPSTGEFGACYASYIYTFTVSTDMLQLHVYMDDFGGDDLDLFLLYDDNGDGVMQCGSEVIAYSGNSAGSPEEITVSDPSQGTYWVAVDPYAVSDPAGTTCDLLIDGLELGPTIQVTNISGTNFGPHQPLTFDVFNAPGTCSDATQSCLGGWVRVSLLTSPTVTLFDIPVHPRYNVPELSQLSSKSVSDLWATPGEVLTYTIDVLNTSTASGTVVVTDVLPSGVTLIGTSPGFVEVTTGTLVWTGTVPSGGGKIVSADYEWVDISNPANGYYGPWMSVWRAGDDEGIFPVTLPFTYTFFGTDYITAYVSANGQVQFDLNPFPTAFGDGLLPGDDGVMEWYWGVTNGNRIAALFGDQIGYDGLLNYWGSSAGMQHPTVFTYHDDGGTPADPSDDRFIIQWDEWVVSPQACFSLSNVGCELPHPDNTYQVILYPDGRAKVQYAEINQIPPSELVYYGGGVWDYWNLEPEAGVEGPGDSVGYRWQQTPASGLAWMYVPTPINGVELTVTVQIDDPISDTLLCNTAHIDNLHGEITDLSACTEVLQADLDVSKSVDPTLVATGDTVTFTLNVENYGPYSTTVTITDTLDAGLTFGGFVTPTTGFTNNGQVITGSVFLTESGAFQMVYTATVSTSAYSQTLCNDVVVNNGYGSVYTDQACVDANVIDLSNSEKNVWWSDPYPWPGTVVTYEIDVYNDSLITTTAWVSDVVPAEVIFGGIVTPTANAGYASGVLTAALTLGPGETGEVIFTGTIAPDLPRGTVVYNEAGILDSAGTWWWVDTDFKVENADFSTSKKGGPSDVVPGEVFTYSILVVNSGPLTATVTVTDPLPSEVEVITSALPAGVTYDPATHVISWTGVVSAATPDRIVNITNVFSDISGVGTAVVWPGGDDDEGVVTTTLPWDFPFLGNTYDWVTINTNGELEFDTIPGSYLDGGAIPDPASPNDRIAPLFGDQCGPSTCGVGDAVYYHYDAANDRFIVQWNKWVDFAALLVYGTSYTNTYQVVLYPDGSVEAYYGELNSPTGWPLTNNWGDLVGDVGVENRDGTYGVTWSGWPPTTGDAWAFYPADTGKVVLEIPVRVKDVATTWMTNQAYISDGTTTWTTNPVETRIHSAEFNLTETILTSTGGGYDAEVPWSQVVTYTFSVQNVGTATSTVTLVDPLPSGVEVITPALPSGMTYDPDTHTLSWSGQIAAGGVLMMMVPVRGTLAAAQADKALFNTFYITDQWGRTFESNPTSLHLLSAEIDVEKFASSPTVEPGGTITYTVVIRNVGDFPTGASAWPATMVDNLPNGVTYVPGSFQVLVDPGFSPPPDCQLVGTSNLVCHFTVDSGWETNETRFRYAVQVDPTLSMGTLLTNTVSVNDSYNVMAYGQSVVEVVASNYIYLPLILSTYP